jgi:hypothetical protein
MGAQFPQAHGADAIRVIVLFFVKGANLDEALRLGGRHRIEPQGIDAAEDRRAGPNAECEREHRYGGEPRRVGQHPQGVSSVLPQRSHESLLSALPH